MKILTLLLAVCALTFASCAAAPKKTEKCCGDPSAKTCPANDPNCKAPHHKHKAS